jgi:membrane fusion protein, multidrug efflux system
MLSEPASAEPAPAVAPHRRRSWWPAAVWLLVAAGAGTAYFRYPGIVERAVALIRPQPLQAKVAAPRVVPVTATAARQADLDLYLNGLGAVVADNTVTIRSRVEGQLLKVAFREGQTVEAGDLLAEIDPRPYEVQLTQAEGALARGEATLRTAERDLERYQSLADRKQVTEQQIDAQRTMVQQCEAATKIDQGVIDNVRLQLDYCRITAPISGRIGLRLVDPGNIVRANDPAGLAVIAQVPSDRRSVHHSAGRDRPRAAGARRQREAHRGRLQPRLPDEARQRNAAGHRQPGRFVYRHRQNQGRVSERRQHAVPKPIRQCASAGGNDPRRDRDSGMAAVQHGPQSTFVYVVQPDSTVELRPVITGASQGDQVNIVSGLVPDELVVTTGIDKLNNKAKVAVRGAPAKPSGQGAG